MTATASGGLPESTAHQASPIASVADHVARYEATGGRDGYERRGYTCIILSHRGRKTGLVRKSPLMKVQHGADYLLVGSFAGGARDPLWVDNLLADPRVIIQDRTRVQEYVARPAAGAERAELWKIAVSAYPPYAEYQDRTERQFTIFRCTPVHE